MAWLCFLYLSEPCIVSDVPDDWDVSSRYCHLAQLCPQLLVYVLHKSAVGSTRPANIVSTTVTGELIMPGVRGNGIVLGSDQVKAFADGLLPSTAQ